jgi:hypothetical protein|tara:strand:- start:494 stop:637 length:144 start_codon:yes stop_codon:yes gene_type:complete
MDNPADTNTTTKKTSNVVEPHNPYKFSDSNMKECDPKIRYMMAYYGY